LGLLTENLQRSGGGYGIISLKRYLDAGKAQPDDPMPDDASVPPVSMIGAYRSALTQMAECGAETCPVHGAELKRRIEKINASIGDRPSPEQIAGAEHSCSELLQEWGRKAASHYRQKAGEVKDILLVMARTAESLGLKDEHYTRQLDAVTTKLQTIANLDDVAKIRASVEESARDLKNSLSRMTAESKTVIDHLRAEVSTYQAKLEKAEHIAASDSLTGLGSRLWIEGRIEQRIDSSLPFSILLIDIECLQELNDEHGRLVGDHLLREFARELRSTCRFSDLVARWGGNRFTVLMDCVGGEAHTQASRVQRVIARPYHVPGRTGYLSVQIEASIGLSEFHAGDSLNELLERADVELAKQRTLTRDRRTA
jgi:diguanylate cyclase (GGDEF)-like protein